MEVTELADEIFHRFRKLTQPGSAATTFYFAACLEHVDVRPDAETTMLDGSLFACRLSASHAVVQYHSIGANSHIAAYVVHTSCFLGYTWLHLQYTGTQPSAQLR